MPLTFFRAKLLAFAFALLFAPGRVLAEPSIEFHGIRVHEGVLLLDFEFSDPFSQRVRETMESGIPTSVRYEIELWRTRGSWFDKLEVSRAVTYQIHFDAFEQIWRVSGPPGGVRVYRTWEEMLHTITLLSALEVVDFDRLEGGGSHYFSIQARVTPVELEQIREVEAWLQGKLPGDESGGGGVLQLPERLFGFVAGLTGFGDEEIEARSVSFIPEALR